MEEDDDQFDDAWEMLQFYLEDWGLESLAGDAKNMLIEGDSIDVITLKLAETDAYKARFSANASRRAAGLPVLSPAEYIATEREYREVMRRNGLPEGFYDTLDDYKRFLENDLSPSELNDRATMASVRFINAGTEMREQWDRFGFTPGMAIAAMLDPDRALPMLERTANAVSIATQAQRAFEDRNRLSVDRADELARLGVTDTEAEKAFGELAGRQDRDQFLGGLSGVDFSAEDLEDELLFNNQQVGERRRKTQREESARFNQNYLSTETGLRTESAGQY